MNCHNRRHDTRCRSARSEATALAYALCVGLGPLLVLLASPAGCIAAEPVRQIPIDDAHLVLAPYVWKCTGQGAGARAEAAMPGAYLKMALQGSTSIGLRIDGVANRGCPAASMPVVEYSIDEGSCKIVPLTKTGEVYTLPLAKGLDAAAPHPVEFYFRAADLGQNRWRSSIDHLCLAGVVLDAGGSLQSCPKRSKRAIGFGDSITEGVGVDGYFTSWQVLGVNNAKATWFPIACAALDCEYGQLGSGGQGMANKSLVMPPLEQTWDHFDPTTSRLTDGHLKPEPDYVVCAMGTNDSQRDITEPYTRWLLAVRKACPTSRLFCVVPPLGYHAGEIKAAVAARNEAGDARVSLIDTAPLKHYFRPGTATQLAYDGVHPTVYGQALLGSLIAVEIQKVLCKDGR
jgi:hypothetical protein